MTDRTVLTALGLMSGTSMDGIDVALIRTDGITVERCPGAFLTIPYAEAEREKLRAVLGFTGAVESVSRQITEAHARAIRQFLSIQGLGPQDIDVIGFHGHTVLHRPDHGETWQIGDGALLARLTEMTVVDDFRIADVAAGGQGAPLVPIYHAALAVGEARPLAVLNIGGVANMTWIGPRIGEGEGNLLAFDTGPGNALIDDWVWRRAGLPMDAGGALALAGQADEKRIRMWLNHPYFALRPPKSLDRDRFRVLLSEVSDLSLADGAATLAGFTAAVVGAALPHLPEPPRRWLVTGGGRHNRGLMAALAARVPGDVAPVEVVGWDGDALEAEAFAFLAVRSIKRLPLTFPGTTGVSSPMRGGRVSRPGAAGPAGGSFRLAFGGVRPA
ncbi:MAG: anhydro-N-acetylmuramic acid kinase [Alphaproteobacteria bacterium]